MKALTSLFGLIPTQEVESGKANDFINGVIRGMVDVESLEDLKKMLNEDNI